ncbi:MAG: deoxyuridine 5'-triphosphate nucleotidohydrolase [Erysipelotrichaceae bacterium]|nr:deoxyuridine 5'-triphosphate nucleotidohydrolase [Erysipelotrichaceae bacterium]
MSKVAKFYKVSEERFVSDWIDNFKCSEEEAKLVYDEIKLPKRATTGSAGYDFYTPISINLKPNEQIKIPTGIRVNMKDDWVLCLFPRSGWGFKFRLQIDNTIGVIDSDYFYSSNEGHIFVKLTNDTKNNKEFVIEKGVGIIQGIFFPYGIVEDDDATTTRDGGFGSTNEVKNGNI